ncbi:MAG: FtsW/RodA/SpoVE family cell cycle protein [Flavobacteriales bacterium]|nr:FtsW/RodA/SpoVE family cell cycle protein [Flavobacteriales bacterium]
MEALFERHLRGDRTIWMVVLFLGLISLLAVYSSIASLAYKSGGGTLRFLFKHGLMLASGGAIMYMASRLRYTVYSRLSSLAIYAVVGLLALTLVMGANLNSASRWMEVPVLGVTFQSSDLAKVVLIVYLARVLGRHREEPWTLREVVVRLMVPVGLVCGLILPANFSTAALLFAVCLMMMFIAQVPLKHLFMVLFAATAVFAVLLLVAKLVPGVLPRLDTWLARIENFGGGSAEANYQVEHAKIAIAHGGILPNGPGSGTSRNYLPHPYSDMIYAFIIEEYGSLIGGMGLLLLYLILLFRGVRIATRSEKRFGSLVAIGLCASLVLQALVNMAVAVNLVPVTGQPLPLVSMGGTSILITCLAIGIVLSVSRGLGEGTLHDAAATKPRTATA